jgi:uncharacterized protein (TIGR01244 family)
MANIASQGFKSVINNRPDGEGGASQPLSEELAASAKAHNLEYAHLPIVPGQAVTAEQIQEMSRLLKTLPVPILGFCRTGTRASNMYAHAQRLDQEL